MTRPYAVKIPEGWRKLRVGEKLKMQDRFWYRGMSRFQDTSDYNATIDRQRMKELGPYIRRKGVK